MPVLRSTVLLDAPRRTVAGHLRDSELMAATLRRVGHRLTADTPLLAPGDEVRLAVRVAPGLRVPVCMCITAVSVDGIVSILVRGPLAALTHSVTLTATGAGTLLLDEVRWAAPLGLLGRVVDVVLLRRLVLRLLAARSRELVGSVAAAAGAQVVVATALVRDGTVLVAQRTRPARLAGRWELPGGRVEPGESEADAVARECREELGTEVAATGRLGTDLPIADGVLRVHVAELTPGACEPRAREHSALRWVGPREMATLDWVAADRAVVADLVALLGSTRVGSGASGA